MDRHRRTASRTSIGEFPTLTRRPRTSWSNDPGAPSAPLRFEQYRQSQLIDLCMARKRFGESSDKASKDSNGSTETERSPGDVDKVVEQPAENEPRPVDITVAHKDTTSRHEAPAPSVVETPGRAPTDRTGKVAAVITVFVLLAGLAGLTAVVISTRNSVPIKIVNIVESVDATDGCEWRLVIELRNNSDKLVLVERIGAVINRGRRGGIMEQAPRIAPGATGTHFVGFRLPASDGCPTADEINHGDLIFHLADGSSVSLRF